jgi:hypothetical protein
MLGTYFLAFCHYYASPDAKDTSVKKYLYYGMGVFGDLVVMD